MKKLLPFIFLLIPFTLRADSASVGGNFRGLNNGDSSILIADNEAQALLNVDLTKNAYGVSKRAGYDDFKTIGVSSVGVRGGYYFTDQSGNNKIIHANNASVFYSLNGGAYTAFYTTYTAGAYWDFVDSQGILYGANSNHDPVFNYNGTVFTFSTSCPAGSQVEAYPDRLVVAGSTANPNNIYFSRAANFSDFTVGDLGDDAPYFEYYGLPGQLVQAIKYALGELLIWTKTSMGRYVGSNQFDGTIDDISSTIGSDQPSTVVTDLGVTYFQATDRHFYAYDGQSIAKISDAISGSVDGFTSGDSKNWRITTDSDFVQGTIGTGLSSSTAPGDMLFARQTIDNFSDSDLSSNPGWTAYDLSNGTFSVVGGNLNFAGTGVTTARGGIYTNYGLSTGAWSFTFNFNDTEMKVGFLILTTSPTASSLTSGNTTGYVYIIDNKNDLLSIRKSIGGSNSLLTSVSLGINKNQTYSIVATRNTNGLLTLWLDGSQFLSVADTSLSSATFISLNVETTGVPTTTPQANYANVGFDYLTARYTSPSLNIGTAISSWGNFGANNVLNGGSIVYAVYGDTNSSINVDDLSSFTSSQTITSGGIPTIATAAYLTWTANFSRSTYTFTPTVNDVTVYWFEGTNPHNWGTVDKDHRILWSVAEGTATAPNSTYIYDPRYQSWLKYSVPFDAPARVGNSIYFGGVSTGVVYQWPTGNTDNGSAINAYWKSKDFIAPDPYVEKDYLSASVVAKTQTGSNLDVIYTINTSSSITKNFSLTDSNGLTLKRINFNLPSGKYGAFFNLQFGNDDSDAPFEFYSFKYDYKPRPWRVMQ